MRGSTEQPYGWWPSPLTASMAARAAPAADAVAMDAGCVYWLESQPGTGLTAVMASSSGACPRMVTPSGVGVGSRVHEYGGGAYLVSGPDLFYVEDASQRVYRLRAGRRPAPITPPTGPEADTRYADLRASADGRLLLCIRESHTTSGTRRALVALPTDGSTPPRTLVEGHDFYAAPSPSPDGRRLAWICWNRPHMPWNSTELWTGDFDGETVRDPRRIAGGPHEALQQPRWGPDGVLYVLSDRSGWWNLYRCEPDGLRPVHRVEAECGEPPWEFGYSTFVFLGDGRVVYRQRRGDRDDLAVLDTTSGRSTPLQLPYTTIKPYLAYDGQCLAFIAATPSTAPAVVAADPDTGHSTVVRSPDVAIPDGIVPASTPILVTADDGGPLHGRYHPPTHPDFHGPCSAPPPLIVRPHPGPTAQFSVRLDPALLYLTSRGFAVCDVNYRGSSGYGRAYRNRLAGVWGIADADDCAAIAHHLIAEKLADPDRAAIAGASAGGFTALRALARHTIFHAAVATSAITDLEAYRRTTHPFQADETDYLVGPYPQEAATYRNRSPVHDAEHLTRPILLIHGLRDTVVPPEQFEALRLALIEQGRAPETLTMPDEGHTFGIAENRARALEAEVAFFRRHLPPTAG